jgi:hypothetical protein
MLGSGKKITLNSEKLMKSINEGRLATADSRINIREKPSLRNLMIRKSQNRRNLNTQQNFYKSRQDLTDTIRETGTAKASSRISEDVGAMIGLDASRKILHKGVRMMSNGFYLIEISKTESMFNIAAVKKRNSNENYLIELEWEKSKEILAQFEIKDEDGDFSSLMDNLEVLDTRLVLLNSKLKRKKKRTQTRGGVLQPRSRRHKGIIISFNLERSSKIREVGYKAESERIKAEKIEGENRASIGSIEESKGSSKEIKTKFDEPVVKLSLNENSKDEIDIKPDIAEENKDNIEVQNPKIEEEQATIKEDTKEEISELAIQKDKSEKDSSRPSQDDSLASSKDLRWSAQASLNSPSSPPNVKITVEEPPKEEIKSAPIEKVNLNIEVSELQQENSED